MVDLSEAAYAALGAAIGGIGMLVAGVLKSKSDMRLGMTKEQRLMLEAVFNQVQLQSATIDGLHRDLANQREYYEAKLDDVRIGYRQRIDEQEAKCHAQIAELRSEVQRLNLKLAGR